MQWDEHRYSKMPEHYLEVTCSVVALVALHEAGLESYGRQRGSDCLLRI